MYLFDSVTFLYPDEFQYHRRGLEFRSTQLMPRGTRIDSTVS